MDFRTAICDVDQNLCLYIGANWQDRNYGISACPEIQLKKDDRKFTLFHIQKGTDGIVRICDVANKAFLFVGTEYIGMWRDLGGDLRAFAYSKKEDFSNEETFKRRTAFQIIDLNDGTFRIYHPDTQMYLFTGVKENKGVHIVYACFNRKKDFDKRTRFRFSNLEYHVSLCFERIIASSKQSQEKPLNDFLQCFPKGGDLHCHMTGAIHPHHYLRFAIDAKLLRKKGTMIFCKEEEVPQNCREEYTPAEEILSSYDLQEWFFKEATTRGQPHSFNGFFNAFNTIESITRYMPLSNLLVLLLEHACKQKIHYTETSKGFELELNPQEVQEYLDQFPKVISGDITDLLDRKLELLKDILAIKQKQYISNLNEASEEKQIPDCLKKLGFEKSLFSFDNPAVIRLNVDVNREQDLPYFFADLALAFQLIDYEWRSKNLRILGIVISGRENHARAIFDRDSHYEIIDYFKEKYSHIPFSPHAGELCLKLVPEEIMRDAIKTALKHGAKRIGHGVTAIYEGEELVPLIEKNNGCIELCLTSNEITLGMTPKDHPIKFFIEKQIPFTINTDDAGVNSTDLTAELRKLILKYLDGNISYLMLKQLSRNALRYSFLEGMEIFKDSSYELLDCFAFEPLNEEAEFILKKSPKASMQYKLEKAFVEFEKWVVETLNSSI